MPLALDTQRRAQAGAESKGGGVYFRLSNQRARRVWGAARFGLLSVIYELPQSNRTTGTTAAGSGVGKGGASKS